MRVKEENEKSGLKFSIQKIKFMAHSPITSWQREGRKVEAEADFIFLDSEITSATKLRILLLGRKTMTNLDSMLKSLKRRHVAYKGPDSQGYGFSSSHVHL